MITVLMIQSGFCKWWGCGTRRWMVATVIQVQIKGMWLLSPHNSPKQNRGRIPSPLTPLASLPSILSFASSASSKCNFTISHHFPRFCFLPGLLPPWLPGSLISVHTITLFCATVRVATLVPTPSLPPPLAYCVSEPATHAYIGLAHPDLVYTCADSSYKATSSPLHSIYFLKVGSSIIMITFDVLFHSLPIPLLLPLCR